VHTQLAFDVVALSFSWSVGCITHLLNLPDRCYRRVSVDSTAAMYSCSVGEALLVWERGHSVLVPL